MQEVTVSPARATLDPASNPPNHAVTITGTHLSGGNSRLLILRNTRWIGLVPSISSVAVHPELNPNWQVIFATDVVTFNMQATVDVLQTNGIVQTIPILPGIYSASVRTLTGERLVGNQVYLTETETAETAFALGSRIQGHTQPGAGNERVEINIVPVFDLATVGLRVELIIGGGVYIFVTGFIGNIVADEGSYILLPDRIVFQPLFDVGVAGTYSVQLIVNGAPSQPFWLEITP